MSALRTNPLDAATPPGVAGNRGSWNAAGLAGAGYSTVGPSGLASAGGEAPSVQPLWADPHAPWICIEHRANCGARVRLDLRRNGFEVHWPREVVRIRGRDDVLRPFFPGYLFALPVEPRASWHGLKERGQFGLFVLGLRELGRPARPPPGFVAALIQRAGGAIDGVIPAKEDEIARLTKGDPVLVKGWGREDWGGIFVAERGKRVEVMLSLFGREIAVPLDPKNVRKA